jgi:hypothetical protein
MPGRLEHVRVQFATRPEPLSLSWDSCEKLLDEIRGSESARSIVAEFENAGASRPVELTLEQKAHLFELIEAWANRLPSISELPAAVWDLRCHLADDLDDVDWLRPARNWVGHWG